jgi:hypothetical protein
VSGDLALALGTHAVRACCPRHPAAGMRRFGDLARCYECGDAVDLCCDAFGSKECVLARGHAGGHCSPSGSSWPREDAPRDAVVLVDVALRPDAAVWGPLDGRGACANCGGFADGATPCEQCSAEALADHPVDDGCPGCEGCGRDPRDAEVAALRARVVDAEQERDDARKTLTAALDQRDEANMYGLGLQERNIELMRRLRAVEDVSGHRAAEDHSELVEKLIQTRVQLGRALRDGLAECERARQSAEAQFHKRMEARAQLAKAEAAGVDVMRKLDASHRLRRELEEINRDVAAERDDLRRRLAAMHERAQWAEAVASEAMRVGLEEIEFLHYRAELASYDPPARYLQRVALHHRRRADDAETERDSYKRIVDAAMERGAGRSRGRRGDARRAAQRVVRQPRGVRACDPRAQRARRGEGRARRRPGARGAGDDRGARVHRPPARVDGAGPASLGGVPRRAPRRGARA